MKQIPAFIIAVVFPIAVLTSVLINPTIIGYVITYGVVTASGILSYLVLTNSKDL